MKKVLVLLMFVFASATAYTFPQELFISEYAEGTSSNRYIEIYNPTTSAINLNNYVLRAYTDGNLTVSANVALNGTIQAGGTHVVANSSARAEILTLAQQTSGSVVNFTGNDVITLYNGITNQEVDQFGLKGLSGNINVAGASGVGVNRTIIRKPTVFRGNTNWEISSGTNYYNSEWFVRSIDDISDLGKHTFKPYTNDLIISEYGEGTSNNKWIEIFNGTLESKDLSQYSLLVYSNGRETSAGPNSQTALSGTLEPGGTYLVVNNTATNIEALRNAADLLTGNMSFNGDDAVVLVKGSDTLDVFGAVGLSYRPPLVQSPLIAGWDVAGVLRATADRTLVRKPNVYKGGNSSDTWAIRAGTTEANSEWIVNPTNDISNIKMHSFNSDFPAQPLEIYRKDWSSTDLALEGWVAFSVASNRNWALSNDGQGIFAQINGFGADVASNDYLISPAMNLGAFEDIYFNFRLLKDFNGPDVQIYIGNQYPGAGNPESYAWTEITAAAPIKLDQYRGNNVRIAFRYTSSGTGSNQAASYRLDAIRITGFERDAEPVRMNIISVLPASPLNDVDFTVTIGLFDATNTQVKADKNYTIDLLKIFGQGTLSGQTQGQILTGQTTLELKVKLNALGSHTIRAVDHNSNGLIPSDQQVLNVKAAPARLEIDGFYSKGHTQVLHPSFRILAINADGTTNTDYTSIPCVINFKNGNTIVSTFEVDFVNGVALFNNVVPNVVGTFDVEVLTTKYSVLAPNAVSILARPTMTTLMVPRYHCGNLAPGVSFGYRLPSYTLVQFNNLHPNTEYRFSMGATNLNPSEAALQSTTLFGENLHFDYTTQTFATNGIPNLNWVPFNDCQRNSTNQRPYSTFKTSNSTSHKQWFGLTSVNVAMFHANVDNAFINYGVELAFETGNRIYKYLSPTNTKVQRFGNDPARTAHEISGIVEIGNISLQPKQILALYSNADLNRPYATAIVQGDGATIQTLQNYDSQTCQPTRAFNHSSPTYYRNIDGYYIHDGNPSNQGNIVDFSPEIDGAWGSFVPNNENLSKIEVYDLDGNLIRTYNNASGIWNGVNTNGMSGAVNPEVAALNIELPDLRLDNFKNLGNPNLCKFYEDDNTEWNVIKWTARGIATIDILAEIGSGTITIAQNVTAVNDPINNPNQGQFRWNLRPQDFENVPIVLHIRQSGNPQLNDKSDEFKWFDPPVKVSQTTGIIACAGENIVLDLVASGTALNYQWYKDGVMIQGATNAQYQLPNVSFRNSAVYTCMVSNNSACAAFVTDPIVVYVIRNTIISVQPEEKGAFIGGFVALTFEAHTQDAPPQYKADVQWYKDGVALVDNDRIAGSRSNYLTIRNVNAGDINTTTGYYAVVTGKCNNATTNTVKIIEAEVSFVNQPQGSNVCEGENVLIAGMAETNASQHLVYQWYKDNIAVVDNSRIKGAKTNSLIINNSTKDDSGEYRLEANIFGSGSPVSSNPASVVVNAKPVITTQPAATISVEAGKELTITVVADNASSYQWYFNGSAIANATQNVFTITAAEQGDAGQYYATAINSCGFVQSTNSVVSVTSSNIVSSVSDSQLSNIELHPVVPNPVNGNFEARFTLNESDKVRLYLIDAAGSEICQIFDGIAPTGTTQITYDLGKLNIASGTYILVLDSKNITKTQKISLSK